MYVSMAWFPFYSGWKPLIRAYSRVESLGPSPGRRGRCELLRSTIPDHLALEGTNGYHGESRDLFRGENVTSTTGARQPFDGQLGVDIENLRIPGAYVCLIYDDDEERQEVVLRFIEAGIRAGERVAYFAESMDGQDVRAWLQARGVDIPEAGRFTSCRPGTSIAPMVSSR